ncbi:MAG: blue (type 1) copper domain protein [Bacilli bacterium]|nr:blue (type 1) copper domain protein [Bacilli bacterium]
MRNFKKIIVSSVMLFAVIMALTVLSAMADGEASVKSEAQVVGDLGILVGDGNGLTAEYLNKPTTRIQAAIMFLRLKGLEAEAMAFQGTENFKDANLVWAGGQPILAYLKANPVLGWVGAGDGNFDPLSSISAQQYYKVLLEALGFMQGMDFEYANVIPFAEKNGLSKVAGVQAFKNANIATATIEALKAKVNGGDKTLAVQLSDDQKIDATKLGALQYTALNLQQSAALGNYLADSNGMTLYLFTKDTADVNSCTDKCLAAWPIYYAENLIVPAGLNAEDFSSFKRTDGKEQSTYKGWPLYYYVKDTKAGDTTGQNVGKVWFVLDPAKVTVRGEATPAVKPAENQAPKTYSIDMQNFKFSQAELTVEVGSTVTWTNKDSVKHNAVAVDGSFSLPLLANGESGSFTFTKPGVYDYYCEPHKSFMKATIIVK